MRIDVETISRSVYSRFLQGPGDYNPFTEWQTAIGGFEYSTLGPGNNEGVKNYSYGVSSHKIRYVDYVSPDIFLVHQSKMVGFYLKMSSNDTLKPVTRSVKDHLLRDASVR